MGKKWKHWQILFSWAPKSLWTVTTAMKLKDTCFLEGKLWQTRTVHYKAETSLCQQELWFFPSKVMYWCESWTIKKVEHQRTDAFKLWCWRRLLRVPWISRRSNKSILQEINPEHSLEGLMLKLKLQYFGQLMWIADLLEKRLWCWERLKGKGEGGGRGWDG